MDNNFEIPLLWKGKDINLPAVFISTAFSYKLDVDVYGSIISFEPDEEGSYRAILQDSDFTKEQKIDKAFIEEIANQLQMIFKN